MNLQRFSILLTLVVSALMTTQSSRAMTIARDGKPECVIVVAANASEPEKNAANELQAFLQQVTGAAFEIKPAATDAEPAILVGASDAARTLLPDVKWETLGQDGVVLKTVGDNRLVLAGGSPRGTLYAVYTFLEDHVGVRWWTDTESTIPKSPALEVKDLDTVYVPKLRYRESFHYHVMHDNDRLAARFKLNGHHHRVPPKWGDHYDLLGWCHTSFDLVTPDKHFATHPEWYSFRNGKRDAGGQLCWTNPEMQKELARVALRRIRNNPAAGMISVSQEDRAGWCECDECKTIDDANGGAHSASLITGVNAIAEIIAKEYPDFLVETLAYQYTRQAPTQVKPRANVLVRLCSIECDFAHPLAASQNDSFGNDLRNWAKLSTNLFIWNYTTNFSNYIIPHPNLNATADDLRFFVDNKVVGVFEQADCYNRLAGDMLPLRAWLQAHLMWDPSRDQQKLIDEFLAGYFGAAGPKLGEYLKAVNARSSEEKFHRGCYHPDADFFTPEMLAACNQFFDEAEQAVAGDETLLNRVRRERLVLEHANLLRFDFAQAIKAKQDAGASEEDAKQTVGADYEQRATAFCDAAVASGVQNFSEGLGFAAYRPSLVMRHEKFIPVTLPKPGEALPANAADFQENQFKLHRPGELVEIVADAKASNGKAARMPGGHTEWAVKCFLPSDDARLRKGPWKCYIVARVKLKNKTGGAFRYGLYDTNIEDHLSMEGAPMSIAGDEEYHTYGLRFDELNPGMYFWICPPGGSAVESVYVDRIYVCKPE